MKFLREIVPPARDKGMMFTTATAIDCSERARAAHLEARITTLQKNVG